MGVNKNRTAFGEVSNTPNVVIENTNVRLWLGAALFIVSLLTGIAALFFNFFPELAYGTDIPTRVIGFINSVASILAGAFGIVVTTPNVPGALKRG